MILYDSVTGDACPTNAAAVGGYIDGPYGPGDIYGTGWSTKAWARYPNALHVTITVKGTPGARAADCEPGAMWPASVAAAWAMEEIRAGRRPTIYGDYYDWLEIEESIDKALAALGLERERDVDGWVAKVGAAVIPPGFVACQFAQDQPGANGGRVDLSVTNGVWPDTVTPPKPTPTPIPVPEEATMNCQDPTTGGTWIVDPIDGHVETLYGAPYLGALNNPKPDEDSWQQVGAIAGITPWKDPAGTWGYSIIVRHFTPIAGTGAWFSGYTFARA